MISTFELDIANLLTRWTSRSNIYEQSNFVWRLSPGHTHRHTHKRPI